MTDRELADALGLTVSEAAALSRLQDIDGNRLALTEAVQQLARAAADGIGRPESQEHDILLLAGLDVADGGEEE